jgi:signal transduction histidine kinase
VSAIAPPQAAPSPPVPPRRPVGVVLYLLLSLALAAMVLIALGVNGLLQRSIRRTVEASEQWAPKFTAVSGVGQRLAELTAPGNQVFLTRDVAGHRRLLLEATDSFTAHMDRLLVSLPAGIAERDSLLLVEDLEGIRSTAVVITTEAESVFATFRPDREGPATVYNARMNGAYSASLRAVRTLRADLSRAQDERISAERDAVGATTALLWWAAIAMFALALGGGWLGFRLTREAAEQAQAREAAHSEVVRAQQDLEYAHAQLMAAHQEMETFSYTVAHDLRAPLRSITGFGEALEQDNAPQLNEVGRGHIAKIRTAAGRMSSLIDELMKLSKLSRQSLVSAPVDLSAMAGEVIAELRQQEPARQVTVTIAMGLTAEGDPALLRAVLQNLLGNAWKFTRHTEGARIEFFTEPQAPGAAPVFVVRDNGAGFDLAFARKLFIAFQRMHTQNEFEGTGVGLATVQRIVQRHGGRVWADAAVGRGATFRFTLRP